MAKFSILDLVALAKQGYSVADVKELISLANSGSDVSSSDDTPAGDNPTPPADEPSQQEEKEESKEDDKEDSNDNVVDYKAKIADLEEKLSKAQKAAQHVDMADADKEKSADDILSDLATSFM